MALGEFEMDEINAFWKFVEEHSESVSVEFCNEDHFYCFVEFDEGTLDDFTSRYQFECEEGGVDCTMMMNYICFNVKDLEGGYGFTMQQLWDHRPAGF